jgi:2-polyprenyl-3-methyl-5-hydroxy-6-metoxy-1,4-benzoquinol methylase
MTAEHAPAFRPPVTCPLCGSRDTQPRETVALRDLEQLYRRELGMDIRPETVRLGCASFELHECHDCALQFTSPPLPGSPAFYARIQSLTDYYQEDKAEFAYARSLIGADDRVLEVGAGAGAFGARLSCAAYTGLEFNAVSIAKAARRGLQLVADDLQEHVRGASGAYTVACAFQVLEHVANPGEFVRSLTAAVAPGGRVILSVPSADSFLGHQTGNPLNLPPHHLTWWPDRCFAAMARPLGLSLEHIEHHPLDAVSTDAFVHTRLVGAMGGGGRRFDTSFSATLRHRMARHLTPLLRKLYSRELATALGESVTAVFARN